MKLLKQLVLIIIFFFKTGNLLSENTFFSVNNILIEKKDNVSSKELANAAIKKGYNQLIDRVLLKNDISKVSTLSLKNIKELVNYYNISEETEKNDNIINYNINFDKEKIHNLFYKNNIPYSDIKEKELYLLPIVLDENEIFIFSNNYFYKNWNKKNFNELIDFILPLENIEIIQKVNRSRNNLLDLQLNSIFQEYSNKNIALIIIEIKELDKVKVYLKAKIQNKNFFKNLILNTKNQIKSKQNDEIIKLLKDEILNLVKSQNLIDIRTPSFLNARYDLDKYNNLVILNSKIKNIDLIEGIFIKEFNKNYVKLRIKYLGKIDKIINRLKLEKFNLKLIDNEWIIKIS